MLQEGFGRVLEGVTSKSAVAIVLVLIKDEEVSTGSDDCPCETVRFTELPIDNINMLVRII